MAQTFEELKKTLNDALNNLKNTCEQVPGVSLEVSSVLLKNYQTLQAVIAEYVVLRQAEEANTPAPAADVPATPPTDEPTEIPSAETPIPEDTPELPGTQGKGKKNDKKQ